MRTIKTAANAIYTDAATPDESNAILSSIRSLVLQELVRCISFGKEVPLFNLRHLTAFPQVAGALQGSIKDRPEILAHVLADPDILLVFLTMNYQAFAEEFEEHLLGNGMGQYIVELLAWSKASGTKLRRPVEYYQNFLVRDPYWAAQANKIYPSSAMMRAVAECAVLERRESPSAALYFLLSRVDEPVEPYQELFRRDMQYAYLGLVLLYSRGFTAKSIDIERLSPRWAYHFMMYEARIPEEACEAALLKSPEWMVEYIVDKELADRQPERVTVELYPACIRKCHPHPAIRMLHSWHRRRLEHKGAESN